MTSPRALLTAWKLHPKKRLGQNFLSDPSTAAMIVARSKIMREDVVLEIGAGLGALTIPLARAAHKVYGVEKDRQMIDLLKTELLASNLSNVVLMEKNILDVDIVKLAEKTGRKLVIIGNLPYNISSQVAIQLIQSRNAVSKAVLMFQKELAQRITAQPGSKDYGRLTVMLQYCAVIKKLADVKATLFFPKPKVDSEILELRFKNTLQCDETLLFRIVKAAFAKRRKTLKNALSNSELHIDAKIALQVLNNADIDPSRRAETLTLQEFIRLSNRMGDSMLSAPHQESDITRSL